MPEDDNKIQKENWKIIKKTLMTPKDFVKQYTSFVGKACFTYDYTMYGQFENWEVALNILNNLPEENRHFHEKLMGDTIVKPYLDIEFFESAYPDVDIDELKVDFKESLLYIIKNVYKHDISAKNILFASCHRDIPKKGQKYSYHIVINSSPQLVFANATYAKNIAEKLQKHLDINYNNKYKKIVDLNVYKKSQNFRMIGHSKNVKTGCKSGEVIAVPFKKDSSSCDLIDFIVSDINNDYILLEGEEKNDSLHYDFKDITRVDLADDPEFIREILGKVKMYHPSVIFNTKIVDAKGFYQFNYTNRTEKCFTSEDTTPRYHDNLGFYAYITKKGIICLGCFSANCVDDEGKKIIKDIGTRGSNKKKEFKKVHFDETDYGIDDSYLIETAIHDSAYGMADLFCKIYQNPNRIKWIDEGRNGISYFWNGFKWESDERSFLDRLSVKSLVSVLRKFNNDKRSISNGEDSENISSKSEDLIKASEAIINKLNGGHIHKQILTFAKPLISDPEFSFNKDIHPGFLACKNGMVNLCTGELRLAIPDDNITKTLETNYDEFADSNMFDRFVQEITSPLKGKNKDTYNYFKWLIGYAMHGNPIKKLFVILYGPHGNNGKSLVMSTIKTVLEHYAVAMDKSVVLEGPKKTAGSHSTELAALENARFGFLGDTRKDDIINDGQIKQITGVTDKMSIREIFGKQREFKPVFVPFIGANFEVQMNLSDKAMYERVVILHFVWRFTGNPKENYERLIDDELDEKLNNNKEGTLKWLIDAAKYYYENKDTLAPDSIIQEKEKYNKKINIYIEFIDSNFTFEKGSFVYQKELLSLFKIYCSSNNLKYKEKDAKEEFDSKFELTKVTSKGKFGENGRLCYKGLQCKNEDGSEDESSEDELQT